jgi:hypothetical protein
MSGYLEYIRKLYGDRALELIGKAGQGFLPPDGNYEVDQMVYPQDLFSPDSSPFILFFAVHPTNTNVILDKIALYMPREVSVNYGINFSEATNIFEYANMMSDPSVADYFGSGASLASVAYGVARGAAGGNGLAGKVLGGISGAGTSLGNAASRSNSIGQTISIQKKKTLNPHLAASFEGVNFRRHPFTFDLVARNQAETDTINDIIYKFKYHAHPEAGEPDSSATFWEWPSAWQIGLFSPARKYLHSISTCHITNMNVSYSTGGTRAFFSDTGAPVSVRLSLEFMETELITRGRIRQGF